MSIKLYRLFGIATQLKKQPDSPKCPNCGYVQDRPHSLYCLRCQAEIPGASGCSGCGRCQKSE